MTEADMTEIDDISAPPRPGTVANPRDVMPERRFDYPFGCCVTPPGRVATLSTVDWDDCCNVEVAKENCRWRLDPLACRRYRRFHQQMARRQLLFGSKHHNRIQCCGLHGPAAWVSICIGLFDRNRNWHFVRLV